MDLSQLFERRSDYAIMEAGNFEMRLVYGYGEAVAQNINLALETDLHDLVKQNGGDIHYIDYAEFSRRRDVFENSIYVRCEGDFDMILPLHATRSENRYTIAHELGHYVLHAKKGMCYARRSGGDSQLEHEADCFALGFLMPAVLFKHMIAKYPLSRDQSIVFRVPEDIVEARKRSLGIM
jgi:hypothetical protein